MEGSSLQQALRELLRQGTGDRRGLDELTRQLWKRRRDLQRNNRIDGTLQEVRELLDKALTAEKAALARQDSDDARFRELDLETLPDNTARAVRALSEYDWQSADGRQAYQEIQDLLGREMLDQRFSGMKQAHAAGDPAGRAADPADAGRPQRPAGGACRRRRHHRAVRRIHGASTATSSRRTRRSVDELIDVLAARSAAAQRMMQSLSPEQRAELAELSQQAFGDPRLGQSLEPAGRAAAEPAAGRGLVRIGSVPRRFADGAGRGHQGDGGTRPARGAHRPAGPELPGRPAGRHRPGRPGRRALGEQARADVEALAALERELREQGVFERAPDGSLRLSPKALRRLGESALRDVVDKIGSRRGERATRRSGAAGEPTGASRPWAFGDTESWNVPRTLLNAQLRQAGGDDRLDGRRRRRGHRDRAPHQSRRRAVRRHLVVDGAGRPLGADEAHRTGAAPTDLDPVPDGCVAAHHLRPGRREGGAGRPDRPGGRLRAGHQPAPRAAAGRRAPAPASRRRARSCWWSPTASRPRTSNPTGGWQFSYPPQPETLRATVSELDRLTARRAAITFFVLGDDPRLASFMDALARRCHGRVVAPDLDGLGAEVVADYLRTRQ